MEKLEGNKRKASSRTRKKDQSQEAALNDRKTADEYVELAIQSHEANRLSESFRLLRKASKTGSPLGLFLLAISLRHGWGCTPDHKAAFKCLKQSASASFSRIHLHNFETPQSIVAKGELVLAIYEIGVCYRHGWGVIKNKEAAAFYFQIAADLGYPEAQSEVGMCYEQGDGVKKDMYQAAKYLRLAHAQGVDVANSTWIFKEKYDKLI